MRIMLSLILLTLSLAAQDKAPAKPALPPVPAESASKFQALVIQQQSITSQPVYQEIQQRLGAINAEWQKAEAETLTAMKLDPKTHTIQVTQDGKVAAIPKPVPAAAADKKEESAKK